MIEWESGIFIDKDIQHFGNDPPGIGMAVVYVGICMTTKRIYVGKHAHGRTGRSARADRWKKHPTNTSCVRLHREISKYGHDSFKYAILEHVPESEVAERERFWISKDGLDTLAPKGLNLLSNDPSVPMSDEARARMRASATIAQNRPSVKAANRKRALEQWEVDGYRQEARDKMLKFYAGDHGEERRTAQSAVMKTVLTEDSRKKMSTAAGIRWQKEEQHEEARKRQTVLMTRDDVRDKLSKSQTAHFAKPGAREKKRKQTIESLSSPEVRAKMSEVAMKRREEELAACKSDDERDILKRKFAKADIRNRKLALKRSMQPPRRGGQ